MARVIADERLPLNCQKALIDSGFELTLLPPLAELESAIASHADILIFTARSFLITSKKYRKKNRETFDELEKSLSDVKFIYTESAPSGKYPEDAIFNALVIGEKIFLKQDTVSPEVLSCAEELGLKVVNVKQGYPACTVLPIGDNAAITADNGMARALSAEGIRVTLINDSKKILLPPHRFGFIGGCAGNHEKIIYFIGNIDSHPDSEKIKSTIEAEGFSYKSLDTGVDALYDMGRLFFLR